jgi:magnesium-transporting ATPase (P-type)
VLSIVPFFRKNLEKGKKKHRNIMDNRNLSFNISFAFGYMFFTTMIIYAIIFLYLCFFLQIEVGNNLYYWFIAVVVLSYLTNQILSWRNDKYLKYFTKFDTLNDRTKVYLSAVLFHLGVFVFAALSIYWTVGYAF